MLTREPQKPSREGRPIRGTWLWGGFFISHFGHFLTEGLSRIWALQHYENVKGILFSPMKVPRDIVLTTYQRDLVDLIDPKLRVELIRAPRRVNNLIVAGQALGIDDSGANIEHTISRGTAAYREFIKSRLAPKITASGPEKIFISRRKLGLPLSGLIGEAELEKLLMAEGYTPLYPETMTIEAQLSCYKAARKIIMVDGSAAHLFALVAHEGQEVSYIVRRDYWARSPIAQLKAFMGRDITVMHALKCAFEPRDGNPYSRVSLSLLDLKTLWKGLKANDFVSEGIDPSSISELTPEDALKSNNLSQFFKVSKR